MRQVMPHRNNIRSSDRYCKIFLKGEKRLRLGATFLPQNKGRVFTFGCENCMSNNGLYVF